MRKILAITVIVSLIITLIVGLVDTTPHDVVGVTRYGWPVAWRFVYVTITPSSNYRISSFIIDLVFWFVGITACYGIATSKVVYRIKRSKLQQTAEKNRAYSDETTLTGTEDLFGKFVLWLENQPIIRLIIVLAAIITILGVIIRILKLFGGY